MRNNLIITCQSIKVYSTPIILVGSTGSSHSMISPFIMLLLLSSGWVSERRANGIPCLMITFNKRLHHPSSRRHNGN